MNLRHLWEDLFERDNAGCLPACPWPRAACTCRENTVSDGAFHTICVLLVVVLALGLTL
jgi:hypothetical protein